MSRILIEGGIPLKGEVRIKGAKNSSLPIMAASLLAAGEVSLAEIPDLEDVRTMSRLLHLLGVKVRHDRRGERIWLDSRRLITFTAPYGLVRRMRASFLIAGPLLARMGRARISHPGGCAIGVRPIDLHLKGLAAMGADFTMGDGYIDLLAPKLKGAHIYLDYPSVGATENILMAAVLAGGITRIENAAAEPEVADLANFLCSLGARIQGAGGPTLVIEGVESLRGSAPGKPYSIIPDRIEAGTFMAAAAITGGDLLIENVVPGHLTSVSAKLKEIGAGVDIIGSRAIRVRAGGHPRAVEIKTLPYPGFPTDLQPQFMALLTVAQGTSVIRETVFEERFTHVEELLRMGGRIRLEGRSAIISGRPFLQGAALRAADLRGGASLVLAGLAARGITEIKGLQHIRRGYSRLAGRLRSVGGRIFISPH